MRNAFVREMLNTDLYGITSEAHSNGRDNLAVTAAMIQAGVRLIQYREKEKSMQEQYRQCLAIREMTRRAGVRFIVNDHVDLAQAVDADGVHIGQTDLPIEAVRKLVGEKVIVGLSTHTPDQAREALIRGADYIGVGPIYQTFTKKDVCAPVGLTYLDYVSRELDIPFVAIGGIKAHNLAEVIRHGAACAALVTEIVGAEDVAAKIRELRHIIQTNKPLSKGIKS